MRFLRILPLVCARMECSLSSFTRNIALGSNSMTVPLNSIMSSFDIRPLGIVTNGADHGRGRREGQEPADQHRRTSTGGPAPADQHRRASTGGPAPAGTRAPK